MSSSSPQDNPPPQPTPPTSFPSGHAEFATEGGRALSQLAQTAKPGRISSKTGDTPTSLQGVAAIQLGPANFLSPLGHYDAAHAATKDENEPGYASDTKSFTSGHSSKLGIRKRLSRLFKGEPKVMDVVAAPAATSEPTGFMQRVKVATPEIKVSSFVSDPRPPVQSGGASNNARPPVPEATVAVIAPAIQLQSSFNLVGVLSLDIFRENVATPVLITDLPKPRARIEETSQLAYCIGLLSKTPSSSSPKSDADGNRFHETPLDEKQREWVKQLDPVEQNHLHWLIDQLAKGFAEDQLKSFAVVAEIVLLGPVLEKETYRDLLSCFISKFEQTTPLDLTLLQGLVQLVECASPGFLVDSDLVRIATVLSKELSVTHTGTSGHPSQLTLALSRILDVMVASNVKDLNRDRDHQPMLQLLETLKDSEDVYLKYQAAYAYQALQYAPDDETPLQVVWRYTQVAATAASTVSSVFKLDPAGFLEGLESLQKAAMAGIEGFKTLREGARGVVKASESKFDFVKKHSWYLALQGTALFVRQGRLFDFKQVVCQAPCRRSASFQWGICRQLGEIAVDPLWDARIHQQAVDFLGELYKSGADWQPHADVKRWILTILVQISELSDSSLKDCARTLLVDLKRDGNTEFTNSYPLATRLPLPTTFPLLAHVQEIPKVEYTIHTLKMQRLGEYKQAVYVAPMAKPSLQAPDNNLFPLMDKVQEFLDGDVQVMLILGDSGAGKSTFNRYLEYQLWQNYKTGGRIPLFINLPALDRPDKELVPEQLKILDFSEDQIRELKQHRKLALICDGYDESQLTCNLHTTNLLNRSGQWSVKLLITCRTQYLGPDYQSRFVPKATAQYHRTANDLYQEAVIAPFSKSQIEDYVERYIPLEPRTWVKQDYMDKLTTIPNLMDLVKNPFLLTLALEALPSVVQGKSDLSNVRVTRVELYDTFVDHWLGVNKRRLEDQKLKETNREALDALLSDGFERHGIIYQKELAAAIFQEQDGRPVVEYSHIRDRQTWKARFFGLDPEKAFLRDSSLLNRAGNQYRFVHRSVLEYFLSCTICQTVGNNDEFAQQSFFDSTNPSQSIADHPLSHRSLVAEPSIVQFLAERVQGNPFFKQHLLDLVELSKSDTQASQAATNAITILVKAGVRFNGADLRGIRIPGADLSGGQFDSSQLQESDLTAVNFTKCWIRQTNFSNARMDGVRFGELPDLKEESSVTSCAYSPDGKNFAVGLDDGDINIYDTSTWLRTRSFQGHSKVLASLTYSPTGHQLLSCSEFKTVRLWNSQRRSPDFFLDTHEKSFMKVMQVAFSPCGTQVASVDKYGWQRLWDAQTGAVLFEFVRPADYKWDYGASFGVIYSPDGNHIANGGYYGKPRIFDTHTRLPWLKRKIKGFRCFAYSPDGRQIVSGNKDGQLQLWDTATGAPGPVWTGHGTSSIESVAFSPDGNLIASSAKDAKVKLWDAQSGTLASVFTNHSSRITSVVFSPKGLQLAVCSGQTVRFWEVYSSGAGPDMHGSSYPATVLAYSSDGHSIRSCSRRGNVRQYDAVFGDLNIDLRYPFNDVKVIAFSPDGLQFATVDYSSKDATIWSATSVAIVHTLCGHTSEVNCIVFSPCCRWIATGSNDKTIRLWDATSGSAGLVLAGHDHEIVSVAFSPSGRQIVSVGNLGPVRVWEVETGEARLLACISEICLTAKTDDGEDNVTVHKEGDIATVSYSPTRLKIATNHKRGVIKLWDEQTGEPQHCLEHADRIDHFVFSTCGQWIVTSTMYTREVWLWNSASSGAGEFWSCVTVIRGFIENITCIAWRPYALEFATGCRDGSVWGWKLVQESGVWSVQLVWGPGYSALVAMNVVFTDAIDLSPVNQQLLKQRSAVDSTSSIKLEFIMDLLEEKTLQQMRFSV